MNGLEVIPSKISCFACLFIALTALNATSQLSSSAVDDSHGPDDDDSDVEQRPALVLRPLERQTLEFEFPPLSQAEIEITQTSQSGSGPLQVGFHRKVPREMTGNLFDRLVWHPVNGKKIAYLNVSSPTATSVRLELLLELPKEATLRFFHVDHQGETYVGDEITQRHIEQSDEKTLWTTVVVGDHLSIEFQLPENHDPASINIELKNLSHGFISTLLPVRPDALTCAGHAQVACAIDAGDTTQATADSVVQIQFESGGGRFQCTAALISDVAQSKPYLLTAAHCISTEAEASTLAPFWFNQATSCGGNVIDPRATTTLSGGELIAARSSEDMSLILLDHPPPAAATYATWDSTHRVPRGTSLLGIHHAQGLDKRIWKGSTLGSFVIRICGGQGSCFLIMDGGAVPFDSGLTEEGSSGSPVFLAGTNTIVGVHSGASGSCARRTGLFGKFSNFFPLVKDALDPEIPDEDEDPVPEDDHGNDLANATPISLNSSTEGVIEEAGDLDVFSLEIPVLGALTLYTTGNINAVGRLLDSHGQLIAESDSDASGNFRLVSSVFEGTVYVEVSAASESTGSYQLVAAFDEADLNLDLDDHGNDIDSATFVSLAEDIVGSIEQAGDQDLFRFSLDADLRVSVFTRGSTDTSGELMDSDGAVLASDQDSGDGGNFLLRADLAAGEYFVRVFADEDVTGTYVLHIEDALANDDHGDTRDQATRVQVGAETTGTINLVGDIDYFRIELAEPGLLTVYTTGSLDTYGRLTSEDGRINLRDDDDGYNFNFHISSDVHADIYYIEVTGYQEKVGDYLLHIEFEPWVLDLQMISLTASTTHVEEHDRSTVAISLTTHEPVRKNETIELQLSGTATYDVDYSLDSNQVFLPDGSSQGTVTLSPYRDWINEGDETVDINLARATDEPSTERPLLTLTIQDMFEEEGSVYQTRWGSDLIPLFDLYGGQQTITVGTTVHNIGSRESNPSRLVLTLSDSPKIDHSEELVRAEISIPRLNAHGGSYRHELDVDLTELQADSSSYIRLHVAPTADDNELNSDNNTTSFGFFLNEENNLKVRCETPNRTFTRENPDPLKPYQWHIRNAGHFELTDTSITEGIDLNMDQAIAMGRTGEGTTIGVVDTGLEVCHPDLHANVDTTDSINFRSSVDVENGYYDSITSDPFNPVTTGDHGTSVAGVIAAIENNGAGGRGIAPKARLRGLNYLQNQTLPNLVRAVGDGSSSNDADIAVLGFGSFRATRFDHDHYAIFGRGSRYGRDQRGTLYIKAAGNSFAKCNALRHVIHTEIGCWNSNSDAINNVPYVIVVGAIDARGEHAPYSTSGSNLWISAPSGTSSPLDVGLVTTDQYGRSRGYGILNEDPSWLLDRDNPDRDYMSTFIGTSGAVAQVSGAIAILLEVQPDLTFRDVKHILASTAQTMDPNSRPTKVVISETPYLLQSGWTENGAGYAYHNQYGFGAIDVDAAVEMAKSWEPDGLGSLAVTRWIGSSQAPSENAIRIPDHEGAGVIEVLNVEYPLEYEICSQQPPEPHCVSREPQSIGFSRDLNAQNAVVTAIHLEAVMLRIQISHLRMSDLGIHLISPSGTESILNTVLNNGFARDYDGEEHIYLLSNAFYRESPFGEWKLKIVDAMQGEVGEINAWNLRFYVGQRQQ